MSALDVIAFAFGAAGFICAGWFYSHLWRWAKRCENVEIAIANKGRVQLRGPLTEWLSWANALGKDEAATGRVVYRNNKVSVAILRPRKLGRVRTALLRRRAARERKRNPQPTGHIQTKGSAPAPVQPAPRESPAGDRHAKTPGTF